MKEILLAMKRCFPAKIFKFLMHMNFFLVLAGFILVYTQVLLFITRSDYGDRMAHAIRSEDRCISKMQLLIDKISRQHGRIINLEEEKKNKDLECSKLRGLIHDFEKRGLEKVIDKQQIPTAAVVIMACNRADYLERTLNSVLKYQSPIAMKYPLFISQDGPDPDVRNKALSYSGVTYMQHLDFGKIHTERPGEIIAYYKIARHYKWALDQLFHNHSFHRVIILEDDMEIAPDFFEYFEAGAALLDSDKSIMAVSSWNDNGQKQFVHDPYMLYRSDFFPGLGWMLSQEIWNELSPKWPNAYWDDWMRLEENRKGRQFIRPEICRTYNFGEHGSSLGQFFDQYLRPIKLNDVKVGWKTMDLSYLKVEKYKIYMGGLVKKAKAIQGRGDIRLKAQNIGVDVRIQYRDQADFENIARQFGVFEEWKDGIPRTAYKGIVVFRYGVNRVFLVGPGSLKMLEMENM